MLRKLAVAIVLTGLMSGVAYAGALARTGIAGSNHDMNKWGATGNANSDPKGRVCVFCHTPHNAVQASGAPLWNRAAAGWDDIAYTWATPANRVKANGDPAMPFNTDPLIGPSRLCLSCHDGTVAVDSHLSNQTGKLFLGALNPKSVTDLTKTHPIGFKYADAMTARGSSELAPVTDGFIDAATSALTGPDFNTETGRVGWSKTTTKISDTLFQGYMTCATCHDVHNSVNAVPDSGHTYNYFLRAKEEGSAICLSCHIK